MTYDVLVYGPLFCDLIFTDLPQMPELGKEIFARNFTISVGGSAIVAAGLHRLGARVGLICDLGDDAMSRLAAELLDEVGVDRSLIRQHDYALPQITVALSFPEDRAFVTRFERPRTGPDLAVTLHDNPAKHLHIGSFLAAMDAPEAPALAHAADMTISLDPGWDEVGLRDPRLWEFIAQLDVFLPSRAELCYMMDESDAERALEKAVALMDGGLVVMKDGANGAVAQKGNRLMRVPSLPITPVDTTGAGDAFDAGFIYAMTRDYTLEDCMRYGAVCGALTTIAIGGATGTPVLKEVEQWLPKLPS